MGDSAIDILTGRSANLWTCSVTYGFAPLSSRFSNVPTNFTNSAEGQTVTSWTIGFRPSAR